MRWELWPAGAYLGLVTFSAVYLGYRLAFAPTNSEFAGMPLLILALPWSDWLAPVAGADPIVGWLGLIAGALINVAILALAGRGMRRMLQAGGETQ
jgi:hypothetical protein